MTRQALTQKLYLEVTPPQQGDNLADLDRLRRALEQKLGDVLLPYQAVRRRFQIVRGDQEAPQRAQRKQGVNPFHHRQIGSHSPKRKSLPQGGIGA